MPTSSDVEIDEQLPRVRFSGKPDIAKDDGLAYDPDQDPEEKRKVRKDYRSLNKDTEGASTIQRRSLLSKLGCF
jgi:hypothetical protein